MATTTWNDITVPAGTDLYNLAPDLKTLAESATVIVPAASEAARDAVAAATTPSTTNPVVVYRTDTGVFEVTVDGTTWVKFTGGDTWWVNLTPTAGTTVYEPLSYRRLNGVTYLRGQVRATDSSWETTGQQVTTLPAGMRPANDMSFPTPVSGDSGSYMRITAAGVVSFYVGSGGAASYPNLAHISYPVG